MRGQGSDVGGKEERCQRGVVSKTWQTTLVEMILGTS